MMPGLTRKELDGLIVSFGSPIGADGDTLAQVLGPESSRLQPDLGAWPLHRELYPVGLDAGQRGTRRCGGVSRSVSFSGMRRPVMGGGGDREGRAKPVADMARTRCSA